MSDGCCWHILFSDRFSPTISGHVYPSGNLSRFDFGQHLATYISMAKRFVSFTSAFDHNMSSLHSVCRSWKFYQICLDMLGLHTRVDVPFPVAAVRLYTKNLNNDSIQVRKVHAPLTYIIFFRFQKNDIKSKSERYIYFTCKLCNQALYIIIKNFSSKHEMPDVHRRTQNMFSRINHKQD